MDSTTMVGRIAQLLLVFCIIHSSAQAVTLEGIVLSNSGPVPGAKVKAYSSYKALADDTDSIDSTAGEKPGQFTIELPPGKYFFLGLGTLPEEALYSYHGLNPITIANDYTWLPFFATERTTSQCEDGFQGIGGTLTYQGEAIGNGSVSAYLAGDIPFRGMGMLTNSVNEDGSFWFELPPGKYVIVARKRQDDSAIGPLNQGDLFCYTAANPIEVRPGNACFAKIPCYPRNDIDSFLSLNADDPRGKLESKRRQASLKSASIEPTGKRDTSTQLSIVAGRVTDLMSQPLSDLFVSAYPADNLPLFQMYIVRFKSQFMTKTDTRGFFRLELPPGSYYLVARQRVGEAPIPHEYYGLFEGSANHSISLGPGDTQKGIQIVAEQIMP